MATIDQIKKEYNKLTAPERFALMVAAGARGDQAERQALYNSAPKVTFEFPHVKGLADGFENLTTWHLIQQLGAAATFFMLIHWEDDDIDKPIIDGHTLGDAIRLSMRRFLEGYEAYRAVCHECNIDPETLTGLYPNYDSVIGMATLVIRAMDNENPIELPDLESTKEAYRELIKHAREEWAETRAR